LFSYFFPPSQAVGALRWQKFARHLAGAGIGLDVITLDPSDLARRDDSRLADLPDGIRVFGVTQPSLPSERLERALLKMKRLLRKPAPAAAAIAQSDRGAGKPAGTAASPGSYSRSEILAGTPGWSLDRAYHARQDLERIRAWAHVAAALGSRILTPGLHQAVISCGPPHPVHEAARIVARAGHLPLVIDLRDPWALVERLPSHIASPAWYRRSARDERRIVRDAALVVLNTDPALRAMRSSHPADADRMVCVMNGCDDDLVPAPPRSSRFLVAYAGSVYLDRDPRPLFRAARQVATELGLTPAEFGLEFMGNVQAYGGRTLGAIAAEEGVGEFVRIHPTRPRADALAFLASASMLLSLPQDSEMAIPSKIFEYAQFNAWVLALAEPTSATAELLRGTAADTVSSRDIGGIANALRGRIEGWRRGERPEALARIDRLSRRYQAGVLLAALQPLIGAPLKLEAACAP
jgi:hypothetical protein